MTNNWRLWTDLERYIDDEIKHAQENYSVGYLFALNNVRTRMRFLEDQEPLDDYGSCSHCKNDLVADKFVGNAGRRLCHECVITAALDGLAFIDAQPAPRESSVPIAMTDTTVKLPRYDYKTRAKWETSSTRDTVAFEGFDAGTARFLWRSELYNMNHVAYINPSQVRELRDTLATWLESVEHAKDPLMEQLNAVE